MRASVVAVSLACLPCSAAWPQSYPGQAVTLVVPYPAGGAVDLIARAAGAHMAQSWARGVAVVNVTGADGRAGAAAVAQAAPDGHTLLVASSALAMDPGRYGRAADAVLRDFVPITQLTGTASVLVVHPSLPVKSVSELVALAQRRPGELKCASAGMRSHSHLALALFNRLAGTDIVHVPYKSTAPALAEVLDGHDEVTFVPMPVALPLVKGRRLRALGVTSATRAAALPDLPAMAEAGVPGYVAAAWTAVLAPARTPRPVLDAVHASAAASLKSAQVRDVLVKAGAEPVGSAPEAFGRLLRLELEKWAGLAGASVATE